MIKQISIAFRMVRKYAFSLCFFLLLILSIGPLLLLLSFVVGNYKNFHFLIPNTNWIASTYLTIIYGLTTALFQCLIGVFLASVFYICYWNSNKRKILLTSILVLPYAVPSTISVILFDFAFLGEGYLNLFLRDIVKLIQQPIQSSEIGRFSTMVIVSIWQYTPFFFISAILGFAAVPNNLIVQAVCDGASKTKIVYSILLPIAAPTIFAALALRMILMLGKVDISLAFHEKSVLGGAETLPVQIVTEIFGFGNLLPFAQILMLAILILIPLTTYSRYTRNDYR